MTFTIVCVGRLKEKYLTDACNEYLKRLSALKPSVIEIPPEKLKENPSEGEITNALYREGVKIKEKIPKNSYIYAMCIEGREMTSEELSREIDKAKLNGFSSVTFIIGGSFGLSPEIKSLANVRLSMSRMTFPHQLARVMLLEQIYRADRISQGTRYHK